MSSDLTSRWSRRHLGRSGRSTRRRPGLHRLRPRLLDCLEDRTLLTTWLVTSNSDSGSLGDASAHTGTLRFNLANAASGDTIAFDANVFKAASPQTLLISSTLDINKNLNIQGPGTNLALVERNPLAGSDFPIFTVSSSVTDATLSGLAIEAGTGRSIDSPPSPFAQAYGGGGIYNSGTLHVSASALLGNTIRRDDANTPALGGAIYNDGGTLDITSTIFAGNTADQGGALYSNGGTVTIAASTFAPTVFAFGAASQNFAANSANSGGAIANAGTLTLSNSTLSGNSATASGGGIDNAATLTITGSTLSGNTAGTHGGGVSNSLNTTITSSILYGNTAHDGGGGIYNSGTLSVDGSRIAGSTIRRDDTNNPALGGGIENDSGTVTLTDTRVSGNSADLGGGLYNTSGTVTITGSNFGPDAFLLNGSKIKTPGNSAIDAGAIFTDSGLTISGTTITGNSVAENGGGIYILGGPVLINDGSLLVNNTASVSGGGIYNNADLTLDDVVIAGNTAGTDGGGMYSAGNLVVTSSDIGASGIYGGNSAGFGGGISGGGGAFTISDTSFVGNTAFTTNGGAIDNENFGFLTLSNILFDDNQAHTDGGALYNLGTASITDSTLSNNTAANGTGGALFNGTFNSLTITGSTLSGNAATGGDGGAIRNLQLGSLNITSSTLSGNHSGGSGGVISNDGFATIKASTFDGNSADLLGGVFRNGGTLTALNATLVDNVAANGGAFANIVNGVANLTNVTAFANTATGGEGGGLLVASGSKMNLANTLVAGNLAVTTSGRGDVSGPLLASSASNLIGDGTGMTGVTAGKSGNKVGTAAAPIDPRLGPLALNGGPVATLALLPGSAAIDAGSNLLASIAGLNTDERGVGFNRVAAGGSNSANVDIGAFEVQNYVVDTSDDLVADDGLTSLREALALANLTATNSSRVSFNTSLTGPLALTGGLALNSNINLAGLGPDKLTLQGAGDSASFSVLSIGPGVQVIVSDLTITAGSGTPWLSETRGGALYNAGTLTASNVVLAGNTASEGGAIYNAGSLLLVGSTLTGNSAADLGGALRNVGAAVISTSTLDGNFATAGDGGAVSNSGPSLVVVASTLSNNTAFGLGGALDNTGVLSLANATLFGNVAGLGGGALAQSGAGAVSTLTQTTVTANRTADGTGGALHIAGGTALLNNTLVAGNLVGDANSATADDVSGLLSTASASNLFGTGGSGGLTAANSAGNLFDVADARLGPLASNGGPTKTVALLIGSPAIDAGNNALALGPDGLPLASDQRGLPRLRVSGSRADIGAFELQSYVVNTLTDDSNPSNNLLSLREAISKANADKQGLITFQAGLTGVLTVTYALPTITGSVGISGPGASILSVKRAGGFLAGLFPFSIFNVAAGASASISNLSITGGGGTGVFLFFGTAGGGINNFGNLTLDSTILSGNTAATGGGINNAGTLVVNNSTIQGNSATTGAGINNTGTLTVTNSTLSGNNAGNGGGINNAGSLTMVNSTLYGNTAGNGGALNNVSPGSATLTNVTVTANRTSSAFGTGGGVRVVSGSVLVRNTLIAANFRGPSPSVTADDVSGLLSTSSASNLFGAGGSGGLTAANSTGNLFNVADPKLGLLADNGGPTLTVALLTGSPAIDAGDDALALSPTGSPLTTDQRAKARKVGVRVDIGAYEFGA